MIGSGIKNRLDFYNEKLNQLISDQLLDFDSKMREEAGVYAIYQNDIIIYIGKSGNILRRLHGNHLKGNIRGSHFRRMVKEKKLGNIEKEALNYEDKITDFVKNCKFKIIYVDKPTLLEHFLIAVLDPELNRGLKAT